MPKRTPSTIGESLYWSYANLAMMANVLEDGAEGPGKVHFMIRSKLYAGLCKATMQVRGFFDDEIRIVEEVDERSPAPTGDAVKDF